MTLNVLNIGAWFLLVAYQMKMVPMPFGATFHTCLAVALGMLFYSWTRDYMEQYVDISEI